jgi:hypothetical protein
MVLSCIACPRGDVIMIVLAPLYAHCCRASPLFMYLFYDDCGSFFILLFSYTTIDSYILLTGYGPVVLFIHCVVESPVVSSSSYSCWYLRIGSPSILLPFYLYRQLPIVDKPPIVDCYQSSYSRLSCSSYS